MLPLDVKGATPEFIFAGNFDSYLLAHAQTPTTSEKCSQSMAKQSYNTINLLSNAGACATGYSRFAALRGLRPAG